MKAIFNDTDSDGWGQKVPVTVLRILPESEFDRAEVGLMFEIEREGGERKGAFSDELEAEIST